MNIKEADIVRMTGEAGGFDATPVLLKRFAELVAAHEREECAKLCQRFSNQMMSAGECVDAIRARGNK